MNPETIKERIEREFEKRSGHRHPYAECCYDIDFLLPLIKTILSEKAEEVGKKRMKFAKTADMETHGSYFVKGFNQALKKAVEIVRDGI